MVEICFERNNKSNPFCEDRELYHQELKEGLTGSKGTLRKVDEMSGEQLQRFYHEKRSIIEERSEEYERSNASGREY